MITATLSNALRTEQLPEFEVPVSINTIENASDVQTLDANVYTDFISQKRMWALRWSFLTKEEYDLVRSFYDAQFTLFQYPLLSIPQLNVTNVPVRMTINRKDIVDNCETVGSVEITLRETAQNPGGS